MQKYQNNVSDRAGNAVAGLQVLVNVHGSGVATIYSDNGATVAPNPLSTDADGYFAFYANDGRYDILVGDAGGYFDVSIADIVELGSDVLRKTEAAAADGATKIGTTTGTVQSDLSARVLTSDLLNNVDGAKGAALVSFLTSLSYPDGSTGAYLNDIRGALRADDKRNTRLRILIGVIRNTGTGWSYVDDTGHSPTGFNKNTISVVSGRIQVPYLFNASKVGTLIAVPDETLAAQGLLAGASVGTSLANIALGANLRFLINTTDNTFSAPAVFNGLLSASYSGGTTTVTHPAAVANLPPVVTQLRKTGGTVGALPAAGYNATQTFIEHNTDMGGLATYSGGTWSTTTEMDTVRTAITYTWDATNGKLDVTHPNCTNAYDVQLTARGSASGYLTPRISAVGGSINRNVFGVEFFDASGTKVTTQSDQMNFAWRRPGQVKSNINSGGLYSVDRGFVELDASQFVSATGNLWLFGVMEVAS